MTYPRPGYDFIAGHERPIWTPAGFLARGEAYVLTCEHGHTADAPLQKLVEMGEGDRPMADFSNRWVCSYCGSKRIEVSLLGGES